MKLEIGRIMIRDIRLGQETSVKDGVLTVDKEVAYQRYKEKSKDFIQQYNTGLDVCPINNDLKSTYIKYNQLLEECYILMSKEFNIPIYDMSIHQLDEIINKINI